MKFISLLVIYLGLMFSLHSQCCTESYETELPERVSLIDSMFIAKHDSMETDLYNLLNSQIDDFSIYKNCLITYVVHLDSIGNILTLECIRNKSESVLINDIIKKYFLNLSPLKPQFYLHNEEYLLINDFLINDIINDNEIIVSFEN